MDSRKAITANAPILHSDSCPSTKERSATASNGPQQRSGRAAHGPLNTPRCRAAQRPTPGQPPASGPPLGGGGGEEVAREGRKRRCEGLAERALPGEWGRGPRPGGGVAVGRRLSAAGLGAPLSVRPRGAAGCAGLPCGAGGCPAVRGRAPASPRSGERERRYGAAFRAPGPRRRPTAASAAPGRGCGCSGRGG